MRRLVMPFAAFAIAGCSGVSDPGPPRPLTELPRGLTAGEVQASRAVNQFAFTLLKRVSAAQPGENIFVSPLSVSFSLGMAMNGAAGATLDEMRATLGFGSTDLASINASYKGLVDLHAGLDPSTTFQIANSVWYRQSLSVYQSFIDVVKQAFSADVRSAPFDPTTITAVNDWVSLQTRGKIPTILDEIDSSHVMFLINAIYFKGSWRERFPQDRTADGTFSAISGPQTVKLMRRPETKMPVAWTTAEMLGELVYGNTAFVMTVAVPSGGLDAWVAGLDTARWSALVGQMRELEIEASLPRFKLEYKRELKEDLIALGMPTPFDEGRADFSGIAPVSPSANLFISFVTHKSFVDVNEEGTEAAAVTNTGIGITSAPACFCVNQPFVFAIRERFSGTILFLGKIGRIPAA